MNSRAVVKYTYFLLAFSFTFIGSVLAGLIFELGSFSYKKVPRWIVDYLEHIPFAGGHSGVPLSISIWMLLISFAVLGAVSTIPVLGYRLYQQASTQTPDETVTPQADNSEQSASEGTGQTDSEQSGVENLRDAAEDAVESAETARERNDFSEAVDAYESALNKYQWALDQLPAGHPEIRTELEAAIESARQQLEEVTNLHEDQGAVHEALKPAERSLQEAIVAYIQDDQTLAGIRFRQARDTFEDAHETITETEQNILTEPVAVDVQPDRELSSTTLTDVPVIPEPAATALADSGVETVDDLGSSNESPWTPAAVKELVADGTIDEEAATTLTLLSWWHGDESYEFDTAEAVARRQQQADYGFNHTS